MALTDIDIGIVGAGNMGAAMARGWLAASDGPRHIYVYDVRPEAVQVLESAGMGSVSAVDAIEDIPKMASIIVVAVKPQDIETPLRALSRRAGAETSILSTAAGVRIERLRLGLGPGPHVFRVMPNLAVSVREGVLALATEPGTPSAWSEQALEVLKPLGLVWMIGEQYLDVITAVTGSGPGLLAVLLEGLEDGAVQAGLPRDLARPFVRQMALGTVRVLETEDLSPAALKDRVASPGGTTITGIATLEDHGVRGALIRAVEAAAKRGSELR